MKKIILCFCVFFFWISTATAAKSEILYDYIDASVLNNGDVEVKELVVLSGSISNYNKSILYRNSRLERHEELDYLKDAIYNATSLEDVDISLKPFSSQKVSFKSIFDQDYEELKKYYFLEDIEEIGYMESSIQDGKYYKFYSNQKNPITGILFKYTLKNVVVIHKDIAEINNVFFPIIDQEIPHLEIRVHVGDNTDYLKMWAHGDLSSQVTIIDDTAIATYSKLLKNTQISFRVLFSLDTILVKNPLKESSLPALKKIIELEEKNTHQVNVQKKQVRIAHRVIFTSDILLVVVLFVYWIFVFFRYDKEKEIFLSDNDIEDLKPSYGIEVLDYFWNRKTRIQSVLLSLLHLTTRGYVSYDIKKGQFSLKKTKGMTESEEYLCEFLFEKIGNKKNLKESELFAFLKQIHTSKKEEKNYQNWLSLVSVEYNHQKFYEHNGLPTVSAVFFLLLSVFVFMASLYFKVDFILSLFLVCSSFLFMIYTFLIHKKTKKGAEEYAKWLYFDEHLEDSLMSLEEGNKRNEYVIYSMVFEQPERVKALLKEESLGKQYIEIYERFLKDIKS